MMNGMTHVARKRLALVAGALAGLATIRPAVAATGKRQSYVQLFGPVQNEGSLIETPLSFVAGYQPGQWVLPGAAASTSCKKFWLNQAWQGITWCAFRAEWRPGSANNGIRLFAADDGIVNVQELGHVDGSAYPPDRVNMPDVVAVDVTAAMQTLAIAGVPKNIGWQIKGGSDAKPMQIWQVYLEILESA